jgi:hypothetical protein
MVIRQSGVTDETQVTASLPVATFFSQTSNTPPSGVDPANICVPIFAHPVGVLLHVDAALSTLMNASSRSPAAVPAGSDPTTFALDAPFAVATERYAIYVSPIQKNTATLTNQDSSILCVNYL